MSELSPDAQSPMAQQLANDLAHKLDLLLSLPVQTKDNVQQWYQKAAEVDEWMTTCWPGFKHEIPHHLFHFFGDADIRFKDPAYRLMQEAEVRELIGYLKEWPPRTNSTKSSASKSVWTKLKQWFSRCAGKQAVMVQEIVCDDLGVRVTFKKQTLYQFSWNQVLEIVAYKEDCFGYDSICLGFRTTERDEYFRVMEESIGYKELISEVESRFPDIRRDWFNEVAFPAFALNWTIIWGAPFPRDNK